MLALPRLGVEAIFFTTRDIKRAVRRGPWHVPGYAPSLMDASCVPVASRE